MKKILLAMIAVAAATVASCPTANAVNIPSGFTVDALVAFKEGNVVSCESPEDAAQHDIFIANGQPQYAEFLERVHGCLKSKSDLFGTNAYSLFRTKDDAYCVVIKERPQICKWVLSKYLVVKK
jgi:hypothetical protein